MVRWRRPSAARPGDHRQSIAKFRSTDTVAGIEFIDENGGGSGVQIPDETETDIDAVTMAFLPPAGQVVIRAKVCCFYL